MVLFAYLGQVEGIGIILRLFHDQLKTPLNWFNYTNKYRDNTLASYKNIVV